MAVERSPRGAIRFCCVEIAPEGLAEVDQRGRVVFVPRGDVRRVTLRKGIAAERPWVQALFGCLCFGVAWVAWAILAHWRVEGGTLDAETMSGFAMIPLGIGILWSLFRQRFFLRVELARDVRHLVFRGRVDPQELRRFLNQAEAIHGMEIEREVPSFDRASPYRDR